MSLSVTSRSKHSGPQWPPAHRLVSRWSGSSRPTMMSGNPDNRRYRRHARMKHVPIGMLTVLLASAAPALAQIPSHPSTPPVVRPAEPSIGVDSPAAIGTQGPSATPRRFAAEATAPLPNPQPPITAPGPGTANIPSSAATVWRIPGAPSQPEFSPPPAVSAAVPPARGPAAGIPAEPPARPLITRRLPGEPAAEPTPSGRVPKPARAMPRVGQSERVVRVRPPSDYMSHRRHQQPLNYSMIPGGTPIMANAPPGRPPYPWRGYPPDSLRQ